MIIFTQHCFVEGGGIEKQRSIRSLSIVLNIFCDRLWQDVHKDINYRRQL